MKNITLLLFLLTGVLCNAQTVKATYETTFKGRFGDPMYTMQTKYTYSKNRSLEKLSAGGGTKYKDTLLINADGELYAYKAPIILPTDVVFYKNFDTDSIYMEQTSKGEVVAIKDIMKTFEWVFHDETKTILGYPCKMATTTTEWAGIKTEITAWYAPEINVNDGPRDFHGLPGLILETVSNSKHFKKAIEIEVLPDSEVDIEPPVEEFFPLTYRRYEMIYKRGN